MTKPKSDFQLLKELEPYRTELSNKVIEYGGFKFEFKKTEPYRQGKLIITDDLKQVHEANYVIDYEDDDGTRTWYVILNLPKKKFRNSIQERVAYDELQNEIETIIDNR